MNKFLLALIVTLLLPATVNAAVYADRMEWYEENYDALANETVEGSYIDDSRERMAGSQRDVETMWYYWSQVPAFKKAGVTGFVAEYVWYYGNKKVTQYAYTRKGEDLHIGWDYVYATYSNGTMQPFAVDDGSITEFSLYNPLEKGNNFSRAK